MPNPNNKGGEKCDCYEGSCVKGCSLKHTHKSFFCEVCDPETLNKMIEESKECKPIVNQSKNDCKVPPENGKEGKINI